MALSLKFLAKFSGLFCIWQNVHPIFAVGPILIVANGKILNRKIKPSGHNNTAAE